MEQALDALKTISARSVEVTGRVRLNAPSAAVPLILKRLIPTFIDRFPRVDLDIQVDDRFVNIVSEGFDAGIRLIDAIDQRDHQSSLSGYLRRRHRRAVPVES